MKNNHSVETLFKIIAAILTLIGVVLLVRWLRENGSRLFRGQRGFTLLETLLAVFLIALIGVAVLRAIDTNARATGILDERVQATNLVTAYLENIRQLPYSDNASPYNTVNNNITIPTQYGVAVNIAYSPDGATWATTNASGAYKLQRISISVSRTSGKLVLTTCTFRAKR